MKTHSRFDPFVFCFTATTAHPALSARVPAFASLSLLINAVWIVKLGRARELSVIQDREQAMAHNVAPASPIVGKTSEAVA